MLALSGSRPADQMVARVIRITLAGASYELPVLSIRENREWKATFDAGTAGVLSALDETDDLPAVLAILSQQSEQMLDLLLAYDLTNVLPPKDEIEGIRPDPSVDIVNALRAVWQAANPTLGIAVQAMTAMPTETSSPPTSTPPAPGASRRKRSRTN